MENNNINSSDTDSGNNSESDQDTNINATDIVNGLQNILNIANLQANNDYVSNINNNQTNFNPYFNLDSVNQTEDSLVFDFSYIFPDNPHTETSNSNNQVNNNQDSNNEVNNNQVNTNEANNINIQLNNTEYSDFTNQVMNYLNNSLSNLNLDDTSLTEVINRSFSEKNRYKYVISELGKRQIQTLTFPDSECKNNTCPITQEDFIKDQEISKLPCGHCFNSEAILNWLENEKSECPVCRYKLDSKEVEIIKSDSDNETSYSETSDYEYSEEEPESQQEEEHESQQEEEPESPETLNNNNNTQPLFTPELTQRLLNRVMTRAYENRIQEIQLEQDSQLQRAIYASLEQTQDNDNNSDSG